MNIIKISSAVLIVLSCASHRDSRPSAPQYQLQSEKDKPTHFLISEPTENDGQSLPEDKFFVTQEIIEKLLKVASKDQKVVYIGTKPHWEILKNSHSSDARLLYISAPPYHWLQDMFEVYRDIDQKLLLGVPWPNEMFLPVAQEISRYFSGNAIVIPAQKPHIKPVEGDIAEPGYNLMGIHGTVGGNFERWTESVAFLGQSDFPTQEQALSFSQTILPRDVQRKVLPTSWSYLGHLDEVVKPILFQNMENPSQCRISALLANPRLGLSILSKNKNNFIVDKKSRHHKKIVELEAFKTLCQETQAKKQCENLKWADVFDSDYYKNNFATVQELIYQEQIKVRQMIEQSFQNSCQIDWIDVPQVYIAQLSDDRKWIKRRSGGAIYPNLTNGLVVGDSYVAVDTGLEIFNKHLREQLRKKSMNIEFIEARGYFLGGFKSAGHLHCMTQIVR